MLRIQAVDPKPVETMIALEDWVSLTPPRMLSRAERETLMSAL
jgi:hypothetical protein